MLGQFPITSGFQESFGKFVLLAVRDFLARSDRTRRTTHDSQFLVSKRYCFGKALLLARPDS